MHGIRMHADADRARRVHVANPQRAFADVSCVILRSAHGQKDDLMQKIAWLKKSPPRQIIFGQIFVGPQIV